MLSPVLAFRPASVLGRLSPRSDACPLSLRDLLAAAGPAAILPSIEAGSPDVVRAALVAAKVQRAVVGLAIPAGLEPERWAGHVARTADEVAAALPYFLSAAVVVAGESTGPVEDAAREVWRLVEAGLTHLVLDATSAAPEERGRILAELAAPLQERGLCFDCAVALGEPGAGRRTLALLEELTRRGAPADALSVRCPAPADAEAARAQAGALARLGRAMGGVPVLRRGPVSAPLLGALAGSGLRACSDGGQASLASGRAPEGGAGGAEPAERRDRWQERAAAAVGAGGAERLEARAFTAASEFIEALGAEGSATGVVRALERRLSEDGA